MNEIKFGIVRLITDDHKYQPENSWIDDASQSLSEALEDLIRLKKAWGNRRYMIEPRQ